MPLHDWQFWVVTLLTLWGLWIAMRAVVPTRRRQGHFPDADPSCPNCTSSAAGAKTKHRVVLTVEQRKL